MNIDEVQYLLSAPNADSGYSTPGSVYNSNGMYCSTTQVNLSTVLNNLFPDLTGPQNAAQQVDYQCVFVYNSDDTDTMISPVVWIPASSVTSSCITWAYALDPTGVSNYNSGSQQALQISSPYVAPAGISSYSAPSATVSGGLEAGNIGPGQVLPVWIRRTATGNPGTSQFNFQVTFNTIS